MEDERNELFHVTGIRYTHSISRALMGVKRRWHWRRYCCAGCLNLDPEAVIAAYPRNEAGGHD